MAPEAATAEYTEPQRAAFKTVYATRLRRQVFGIAVLFAAMVPLPFLEDSATYFGLAGAVLGPISFVAIAIGWIIFNTRNWRCPACDEHLGRAFNPRRCRSCGIELRG